MLHLKVHIRKYRSQNVFLLQPFYWVWISADFRQQWWTKKKTQHHFWKRHCCCVTKCSFIRFSGNSVWTSNLLSLYKDIIYLKMCSDVTWIVQSGRSPGDQCSCSLLRTAWSRVKHEIIHHIHQFVLGICNGQSFISQSSYLFLGKSFWLRAKLHLIALYFYLTSTL